MRLLAINGIEDAGKEIGPKGNGRGGRLTKSDVLGWLKTGKLPVEPKKEKEQSKAEAVSSSLFRYSTLWKTNSIHVGFPLLKPKKPSTPVIFSGEDVRKLIAQGLSSLKPSPVLPPTIPGSNPPFVSDFSSVVHYNLDLIWFM
jgi:hypothetical protein